MGKGTKKDKDRVVQLAAQYMPVRLIAAELGCSRPTVMRYLAEYRAELPPAARLTRERLHIAMSETDNLNELLRIAAIQRHYLEAEGVDAKDSTIPDIATVEGRMQAVAQICHAVGAGHIAPAQATVMLACVKEASELDGLEGELARIDDLEARLLGPVVPDPPDAAA